LEKTETLQDKKTKIILGKDTWENATFAVVFRFSQVTYSG